MPRTLQEILEHADKLERRLADHHSADVRDAETLRALRDAVTERAATERRIAEAITDASGAVPVGRQVCRGRSRRPFGGPTFA